MKKVFRIAIVLFVLGILSALAVYKFVYNKPHPDYESEKAQYVMLSESLFQQYRESTADANSKYTGKMIEITGPVSKIEQTEDLVIAVFVFQEGLFGDEGIRCTMLPEYNEKALRVVAGQKITVKGFCTGYNETDVIMEKCTIVSS